MKNLLVVTGGAGFIGSNLIELLIKKTNYQILSIDNANFLLKPFNDNYGHFKVNTFIILAFSLNFFLDKR